MLQISACKKLLNLKQVSELCSIFGSIIYFPAWIQLRMVEKRESRHLQSERTIRCHCVSASSFRWGIRVLFKERKKEVTAHTLSFSTSTHVKTFQNDTLALMWAGKLFQRLLVLCRKHSNHSIFSNRRPFEGLNHLTLMFYSGISLLHVWVLMLACSKDINHRFDSLIERKHASDGKMTGCCWLHKCTHPL